MSTSRHRAGARCGRREDEGHPQGRHNRRADGNASERMAIVAKNRSKIDRSDRYVALYHVVYANEGFDVAAQTLFKLVQDAQKRQPGKRRVLFLDIEGHRNSAGGFDPDMLELQKDFILGMLARFLSEFHCPLMHGKNPRAQENDLPEVLIIKSEAPGEA